MSEVILCGNVNNFILSANECSRILKSLLLVSHLSFNSCSCHVHLHVRFRGLKNIVVLFTLLVFFQPDESVANYAAATGTIGRGGVPAIPGSEDVMSEMARKLKERRARADGGASLVSRQFL